MVVGDGCCSHTLDANGVGGFRGAAIPTTGDPHMDAAAAAPRSHVMNPFTCHTFCICSRSSSSWCDLPHGTVGLHYFASCSSHQEWVCMCLVVLRDHLLSTYFEKFLMILLALSVYVYIDRSIYLFIDSSSYLYTDYPRSQAHLH